VQGVIGHFRNDRAHRRLGQSLTSRTIKCRSIVGVPAFQQSRGVALQLPKENFCLGRARLIHRKPLTSGVWIGNWPDAAKLSPTEHCQLEESDIITFHTYDPGGGARTKCVDNLKRYQRPIVCTEYMAPSAGQADLIRCWVISRNRKWGAYCWGFVNGKTQTIYPWDSWDKQYTSEPNPWFHDILRADGTPVRCEGSELYQIADEGELDTDCTELARIRMGHAMRSERIN